jgi:catalase-peroxidase
VLTRWRASSSGVQRAQSGGKKISLADLIVLAGSAAIEDAAKQGRAGHVKVPFAPGRTDASQAQTDVASRSSRSSRIADGFRNYLAPGLEGHAAELLVDKAQLLTLTGAGDDGAGRRPARARRQRRPHRARRVHEAPRAP